MSGTRTILASLTIAATLLPSVAAAEPGVRFTAWMDQLFWKSGKAPTLMADLSHRGRRSLVPIERCQLDIDGASYVAPEDNVLTHRRFDPNRDYRDMSFPMDYSWRNVRTGEPLALAPGPHRLRPAFDALVAVGEAQESVRITANEVHLYVRSPGQEISEDQWFEFAAGGRPGTRYTADQVVAMHRESTGDDWSAEQLAKYCAQVAIELSQSRPDPAALIDAAEQALAFEHDDYTEARLYMALGDAHQRQTLKYTSALYGRQRRIAAEAYLAGLSGLLTYDLPRLPPPLPMVERGRIVGPPEAVEAFRRKNAEQVEAREEAMRVGSNVHSQAACTDGITIHIAAPLG